VERNPGIAATHSRGLLPHRTDVRAIRVYRQAAVLGLDSDQPQFPQVIQASIEVRKVHLPACLPAGLHAEKRQWLITSQVLEEYDANYEMTSVDEAYLDVTSLVSPARTAHAIADEIRARVFQSVSPTTDCLCA
jgi:hypothetical protein